MPCQSDFPGVALMTKTNFIITCAWSIITVIQPYHKWNSYKLKHAEEISIPSHDL